MVSTGHEADVADVIRLDGKVIVVTGAGRGIGRAYAELLAARGARVVVNDLGGSIDGNGSEDGPADETVAAIRDAGGIAVASAADIRSDGGGAELLEAALRVGGRVDGLVNNAGIISHEPFEELSPSDIQRQLEVHLFGTLNVTQALWPALVASRGAVVNTLSAGMLGAPISIAYSTAKGAVFGFTRSLATVGAQEGVRVNMIMPGAETRMQVFSRELLGGATAPSEAAARRSAPEQVAPLAAVLMSDACEVSGEILYAGHGRVLRVALVSGQGIHADRMTPELIVEGWDDVLALTPFTVLADTFAFRDLLGAPMIDREH